MAKFKALVLRASVLIAMDWPAAGIECVSHTEWTQTTGSEMITHRFRHGGKTYEVTDTRKGSLFTWYEYASDSWRGEIECNEINEEDAE
jgi:hypothetical protein